MKKNKADVTEEFEKALVSENVYILKLYVTGITPKSQAALRNIKEICDAHLSGHYELEVIDVYQTPQLAQNQQLIAAPTLVKELPFPLQRFIGDLSNKDEILQSLEVKTKEKVH